MKNLPMPLPWTLENVPHAILDILRGCNIRCRDCFNTQPNRIKHLSEIEQELDTLLRLRKLHSLSIVGGEITLHPDLVEIVRLVKRRGLFVELFSNGLDLKSDLLARLKEAGTSVVFLHIEDRQHRPDLPPNATPDDLRRLRSEKARLIAEHGMEVGLAVTVYPDKIDAVKEAVSFALQSPHVTYLLVTLWRDVTRMPLLTGSLEGGMRMEAQFTESSANRNVNNRHLAAPPVSSRSLTNPEIAQLLQKEFNLTPFAFLGSNLDRLDLRWLSYMVASVHRNDGYVAQHCLKPTFIETAFLELTRAITGRYPFYQRQSALRFAAHLFLNALAGGGFAGNLKQLFHFGTGSKLIAKRLLFQCPASIDAQGQVVHCHCCPDAVVKGDRLVPLCVSDLVCNPIV